MISNLRKRLFILGAMTLIGGAVVFLPMGQESMACGWNNSGGEAFGPVQNNSGSMKQNAGITKDQAVKIVTQHVNRLNPELRVGNVNDVGPLYEAEILSSANEDVLQVIGVNKETGQLIVIN